MSKRKTTDLDKQSASLKRAHVETKVLHGLFSNLIASVDEDAKTVSTVKLVKAAKEDFGQICEWLSEPQKPALDYDSDMPFIWRAVKSGTCHLIQAAGQDVGFVSMQFHGPERETAWVSFLLVAAGHRRKGYGNLAMEEAAKAAKQLGAKHIRLLCNSKEAWPFWQSCGFLRTEGDSEKVLEKNKQKYPSNIYEACYMMREL